ITRGKNPFCFVIFWPVCWSFSRHRLSRHQFGRSSPPPVPLPRVAPSSEPCCYGWGLWSPKQCSWNERNSALHNLHIGVRSLRGGSTKGPDPNVEGRGGRIWKYLAT